MENSKYSDIDSDAVADKCADIVLEAAISNKVTPDEIFQAVKTKFSEDEKNFLAAVFIFNKLKSFNKNLEKEDNN